MSTAFFIVTNRCTRDCPFCFYTTGYQRHPAEDLSLEFLLKALDTLKALGVNSLVITGGEPLLRRDIIEVIQKAGDLGLRRLLLTNGDLLDKYIIRNLRDCGVEGITLSVNSMQEAEMLEESARYLQYPSTINVTVTTVFSKGNVSELAAIYEWVNDKDWGMIFQPAFIPRDSKKFDSLSPHNLNEEEWDRIVPILKKWGRRQKTTTYVGYIFGLYDRGNSRPRHCSMGRDGFVLDCDGAVYPCFHRRDLQAGNIFQKAELIAKKLSSSAKIVGKAPCYGEHCVSLFYGK